MMNEKAIQIVKSTVPVFQANGTAITKRFYTRMFERHPELLNIFNHANQGLEKQQKALAGAVYAAGAHIDNLGAIVPAVRHVFHKHRGLGVKPEHYPIVGENLLAAIREVLGSDVATDEVIDAWGQAYSVIADAFIGMEAELYREAQTQEGGWEGFRAFKLIRKVKESDVITSFYMVAEDGGPIASFEPGQYISLKMEIPGEKNTHIRQYSLSDAPGRGYYRISVKREDAYEDRPAGKVSVYLHEQVQEGATLWVSAPAGDFKLDRKDERPVVLISGGVGLTPMVCMLNTLAESEPARKVTFIHAARNGDVHALKDHVDELASKHPNVSAHWIYGSPTQQDKENAAYHKEGYIDLPWLQEALETKNAKYYFCGPTPFMATVNSMLKEWGIPASDIHFEFFGPADNLEA
jgi:nitric oxide dioxygenase